MPGLVWTSSLVVHNNSFEFSVLLLVWLMFVGVHNNSLVFYYSSKTIVKTELIGTIILYQNLSKFNTAKPKRRSQASPVTR